MNTRRTLTAIAATAVLALTACTTALDSADDPATTTIVETAADNTEVVVELSWDIQTEADRDAMCDGLALFGPEWAAEQMQLGAGDTTGIDWDRAAVLVQAKCAQR